MSLVGPRPLLMEYLPLYTPEQARRHEVRPGITGWTQVNGRNALTWDEKFALDIWYVDHRSTRLDVEILVRTVQQVVSGTGVSAPGHATMEPFRGSARHEPHHRDRGRRPGPPGHRRARRPGRSTASSACSTATSRSAPTSAGTRSSVPRRRSPRARRRRAPTASWSRSATTRPAAGCSNAQLSAEPGLLPISATCTPPRPSPATRSVGSGSILLAGVGRRQRLHGRARRAPRHRARPSTTTACSATTRASRPVRTSPGPSASARATAIGVGASVIHRMHHRRRHRGGRRSGRARRPPRSGRGVRHARTRRPGPQARRAVPAPFAEVLPAHDQLRAPALAEPAPYPNGEPAPCPNGEPGRVSGPLIGHGEQNARISPGAPGR